jgi:hypothetical protein
MRKLACQLDSLKISLMHGQNTGPANGPSTVRLEDNRICVFKRNGIYQTRIRISTSSYIWRLSRPAIKPKQSPQPDACFTRLNTGSSQAFQLDSAAA